MLDPQQVVSLDGRRHPRRRDGEHPSVEESGVVCRHFVRLLQANPQPLRQSGRVGDHVVVGQFGVVGVNPVQTLPHQLTARQEVENHVLFTREVIFNNALCIVVNVCTFIFELSSLSMYWSENMAPDPTTASFPPERKGGC